MNAGRILRWLTAGLRRLRHLFVIVALVAFAFLHVAAATAGKEEVRVGFTGRWSVNWPIYMLREQLAVRKDPLLVRFIQFSNLTQAESALANQIIHVWAPAPTEVVLRKWRDGEPIKIGAALMRRAPYFLVTGAKIGDPREIRGLTIDVDRYLDVQEMDHLAKLEQHGLKIFKDYMIDTEFKSSAAKLIGIETGTIAAAYIINDLVYGLDNRSFKRFGSNEDFLKFPFAVAAFNRDWAIDNSGEVTDQARRFIDLLKDAMSALFDRREKGHVIKTMMAQTGLSERHVTMAYEDLIEAGGTFATDLRVECQAMHRLVRMAQLSEEQKKWAGWRDILLDPKGMTDEDCGLYDE